MPVPDPAADAASAAVAPSTAVCADARDEPASSATPKSTWRPLPSAVTLRSSTRSAPTPTIWAMSARTRSRSSVATVALASSAPKRVPVTPTWPVKSTCPPSAIVGAGVVTGAIVVVVAAVAGSDPFTSVVIASVVVGVGLAVVVVIGGNVPGAEAVAAFVDPCEVPVAGVRVGVAAAVVPSGDVGASLVGAAAVVTAVVSGAVVVVALVVVVGGAGVAAKG
mmetsp:Transcript_6549/g.20584  ORF Transcript_6549/g.20584 Transcript_6549/m.20584 type:complete len:222 (-) Transcript_6549:420-1085(-)